MYTGNIICNSYNMSDLYLVIEEKENDLITLRMIDKSENYDNEEKIDLDSDKFYLEVGHHRKFVIDLSKSIIFDKVDAYKLGKITNDDYTNYIKTMFDEIILNKMNNNYKK